LPGGHGAGPGERIFLRPRWEMVPGYPREYAGNRHAFARLCPRCHGLWLEVNVNPDKRCNFACVYCEVDRSQVETGSVLDVPRMSSELLKLLTWARRGRLRELPALHSVPERLLRVQAVALSGDGEPTLAPNFAEAVEAVAFVRALADMEFFKLILVTNGSALDSSEVRKALHWFTSQDEIWIKLDGGSQAGLDRINRAGFPLKRLLSNIVRIGRRRPVVLQSLFPLYEGQEPSAEEIEDYIGRLRELKADGANIALVQIYSAHQPTACRDCGHLSLRSLSRIAHQVKTATGLPAEVF
jgi:wyosine [tRNA(Phe)-imidazoG37] synthetase (radical SAM superfamily)